jgi:hypothetical protein
VGQAAIAKFEMMTRPSGRMSETGQTLPMDSAPVPPDVRYCSKSDRLRRECEMTLRADTVEKVESLTSLQIYQNTNDIFD